LALNVLLRLGDRGETAGFNWSSGVVSSRVFPGCFFDARLARNEYGSNNEHSVNDASCVRVPIVPPAAVAGGRQGTDPALVLRFGVNHRGTGETCTPACPVPFSGQPISPELLARRRPHPPTCRPSTAAAS